MCHLHFKYLHGVFVLFCFSVEMTKLSKPHLSSEWLLFRRVVGDFPNLSPAVVDWVQQRSCSPSFTGSGGQSFCKGGARDCSAIQV